MVTALATNPIEVYAAMKLYDFSPVTRTLLRDVGFSSEKAVSMQDAFSQWFSLTGSVESGEILVMLKGDIDEVYHAAVLNTAWYGPFCQQFAGAFVHHTPIDEQTMEELDAGLRYTIDRLDAVYGHTLHPALREWRQLVEANNYQISCVKCPDPQDAAITDTLGHLPNGARLVH
ncbi:MAG TPA: hypothetical protein VNG90_03165 [Candidatus Acidoferrum sp.]|nr:hypothetical protein [Candidatus Acidoferrum sp.]